MRKNSVASAAASLAGFVLVVVYYLASIVYVSSTEKSYNAAYDFSADDHAWLAAFDSGSAGLVDVYGKPLHPNPGDLATPGFVVRLQGMGEAQDLQVVVIAASPARICAGDRIHAWGRFERVGEQGKLFLPPRGSVTTYHKLSGRPQYALMDHLLGLDCRTA